MTFQGWQEIGFFLAYQMTFGELYYLSDHGEIIRLALNYLTVNKFQEETDGEVNPPEQPPRPCLEGVTLEPGSPVDSHPRGGFQRCSNPLLTLHREGRWGPQRGSHVSTEPLYLGLEPRAPDSWSEACPNTCCHLSVRNWDCPSSEINLGPTTYGWVLGPQQVV